METKSYFKTAPGPLVMGFRLDAAMADIQRWVGIAINENHLGALHLARDAAMRVTALAPVGCTLLASKMVDILDEAIQLQELGLSVRGGIEGAMHGGLTIVPR